VTGGAAAVEELRRRVVVTVALVAVVCAGMCLQVKTSHDGTIAPVATATATATAASVNALIDVGHGDGGSGHPSCHHDAGLPSTAAPAVGVPRSPEHPVAHAAPMSLRAGGYRGVEARPAPPRAGRSLLVSTGIART